MRASWKLGELYLLSQFHRLDIVLHICVLSLRTFDLECFVCQVVQQCNSVCLSVPSVPRPRGGVVAVISLH